MPSRNGPSAKSLGLFLPGMEVKSANGSLATIILPTQAAWDSRPSDDHVMIRWHEGGECWAPADSLRYV